VIIDNYCLEILELEGNVIRAVRGRERDPQSNLI
jgi:hypothetical protein